MPRPIALKPLTALLTLFITSIFVDALLRLFVYAEKKEAERIVGAIGFLCLVTGFLLQAAGTAIQAIG